MSFDAGGYRERWTVPCSDLLGQRRRTVIAPSTDRSSLLMAMPADTVRLTAEQALEMARDLTDAVRQMRTTGEETEPK